jgi:hypothetical protein
MCRAENCGTKPTTHNIMPDPGLDVGHQLVYLPPYWCCTWEYGCSHSRVSHRQDEHLLEVPAEATHGIVPVASVCSGTDLGGRGSIVDQ